MKFTSILIAMFFISNLSMAGSPAKAEKNSRKPASSVIMLKPGEAQEVGESIVVCGGSSSAATKSIRCGCYVRGSLSNKGISIDIPADASEAQQQNLADAACIQKLNSPAFAGNCR